MLIGGVRPQATGRQNKRAIESYRIFLDLDKETPDGLNYLVMGLPGVRYSKFLGRRIHRAPDE
jgi:hypothetical protein